MAVVYAIMRLLFMSGIRKGYDRCIDRACSNRSVHETPRDPTILRHPLIKTVSAMPEKKTETKSEAQELNGEAPAEAESAASLLQKQPGAAARSKKPTISIRYNLDGVIDIEVTGGDDNPKTPPDLHRKTVGGDDNPKSPPD